MADLLRRPGIEPMASFFAGECSTTDLLAHTLNLCIESSKERAPFLIISKYLDLLSINYEISILHGRHIGKDYKIEGLSKSHLLKNSYECFKTSINERLPQTKTRLI